MPSMDGHSPSRRPHGFVTNRLPPFPAFPDAYEVHHRRDSSRSDSESSSEASGGGSPPRGQPGHATRRPQFAGQTPNFHDRRRPTHLHATIYVDDPPYVPREPSTRPSNIRYAPPGGHEQVQHAPAEYRGRVPPLPPHTPSAQYSRRRSSSGSPSGSERSERSQESDGSGRRSERSASSDEHVRERAHGAQQRSMASVFHVYEPAHAPPHPPFNPDRYPAYDAQARRIGLEHVRHESAPHDPSGQTYYRPRTHTYPSARELRGPPSPPDVPMAPRSPVHSPPSPLPSFQHSPSPPTPRPNEYDMRRLSPDHSRVPMGHGSPTEPPRGWVPPEPIAQSPPPTAAPAPMSTTDSASDSNRFGTPVPEDEVTLDMLADPTYPDQKPNYPYPTLVKAAILSSPKRRLTLQEIYQALQDRFQWFRDNAKDKAWQNSIRHNLSLNKIFLKMQRDITEPGKGSYWTVNFDAGMGNKRERKRNKRPTKAERERRNAAQGLASASQEQDTSDEEEVVSMPPATTTQTLSQSLGQTAAFSVSVAPLEEYNIDPELRVGGHFVGQGRVRMGTGATERTNARRGQSPYTRAQGSVPAGPPQPAFGQPSFGQPSFGQPAFATFQGSFTPGAQPPARPAQPISTAPTFRVTMPSTGRSSGRSSNAARGRTVPSPPTMAMQVPPVPIAPILQPTLHPSLNFTSPEAPDRLAGDVFASGADPGVAPVPPAQAYRQRSASAASSQD